MSEHDDNLLADLFKHPGFEVLKTRVNAELDRKALSLATLITRTDSPVDQRKVDRERGFQQGVLWFLNETKKRAKAFEKGGDTV